jgi:deoxyribose-phosphate aldolase
MTKAVGFTDAMAMVEESGPIDPERLEKRAEELAGRSTGSEPGFLELAIRCTDLTSLNDDDTTERIAQLCATGMHPDSEDPAIPPVAAVCIHPEFVPTAVRSLSETGVRVAAVGGFPTGVRPTATKLDEIRGALTMGADEIDMTMNRSDFLAGNDRAVFDEVAAAREICGDHTLKVILETGALRSYDEIRRASILAMAAGADFVKTSTGKRAPGATLPAALCIMEAIRDTEGRLGRRVGIKVSGGIRDADSARRYLRLLRGTLGGPWMGPDLFRIGASSLLQDLVRGVRAERSTDAPGGR